MSEQQMMITKFIQEGCKVELQPLERSKTLGADAPQRTYATKLYEIVTEDTMEVLMPMEQGKLILLPVDQEFDAVFYGQNSLYQCVVRISDRYKSNNVYILLLELLSNLRKYQRREYYRFSCVLEMGSRNLEKEELESLEAVKSGTPQLQNGQTLKHSVIVDISGGGLRFISSERYEPESFIHCSYTLLNNGEKKQYDVVGKVLAVKEMENRRGTFEHRVQYYNMNSKVREEIIKYIFEEERKSRRK